MKALEEMSLVDDFLMNSLTGHKVYGEAASRYILECIFQREVGELTVVPQRFLCGESPEEHGVRLDVYLDENARGIHDIEPDQNGGAEEKAVLPRRTRFYHAKIDAANLVVGEDYGCLRDVAVIFITTYDPFDRNRMVYTVRNRCLEVPDLPFEDGAVTLYLYTKGTKGDVPGELKHLLRYMEDSTEGNAVTEGLKELHRMVTAVKRDGEVGVSYMKSFEREERIRREARNEGRSEGLELGRSEGLELGRSEGLELGRSEGLALGRSEGLELGRSEGLELGRSEGLELGRSEGLALGRSEGLELGRSEGLELGRSEGLALGKELGVEQEKRNTVRRMLGMKLPPEQIAQFVGENVETVREWMKEGSF